MQRLISSVKARTIDKEKKISIIRLISEKAKEKDKPLDEYLTWLLKTKEGSGEIQRIKEELNLASDKPLRKFLKNFNKSIEVDPEVRDLLLQSKHVETLRNLYDKLVEAKGMSSVTNLRGNPLLLLEKYHNDNRFRARINAYIKELTKEDEFKDLRNINPELVFRTAVITKTTLDGGFKGYMLAKLSKGSAVFTAGASHTLLNTNLQMIFSIVSNSFPGAQGAHYFVREALASSVDELYKTAVMRRMYESQRAIAMS